LQWQNEGLKGRAAKESNAGPQSGTEFATEFHGVGKVEGLRFKMEGRNEFVNENEVLGGF